MMKSNKPKAFTVAFAGPIPVGSKITVKGQAHELVEVLPYQRRAGSPSNIFVWNADCTKCGAIFSHRTGRAFTSVKRLCDSCAEDFKRVRGQL